MALAPIIWQHPNLTGTNIHAFRLNVNRKYSLNLKDYKDLHTWSVNNIESFALAFWTFAGLKYHDPPIRTFDHPQRMFPPPKWFPGATMNFTENLLCAGLAMRPDAMAVTAFREALTEETELTYAELEKRVAVWATGLRKLGVTIGDRVAGEIPGICFLDSSNTYKMLIDGNYSSYAHNSLDGLLVMLATGAVGAIFSAASLDMGAQAIMGRYSQLRPKILVCETSVRYGGKVRDIRQKISQVHQELEQKVLEFKYTIVVRGLIFLGNSLTNARDILNPQDNSVCYEILPFDHPIYILYSDDRLLHAYVGAGIIHAAGRVLMQNKKEFFLHYDVGPYSTFYQYTTTGWMMWNFMIAGLSIGMRIVLYDGSPLYPSPANQLDLVRSPG